jgi:hypothetical protein
MKQLLILISVLALTSCCTRHMTYMHSHHRHHYRQGELRKYAAPSKIYNKRGW